MRTRLAAGALLAAALLALAPVAAGAAPRTSLSEVESEVMCPVCGTLLELAESPQAQREKVFIKQLVRSGASKEQIKDALVAEYGREVLALPEGEGFSLSAYVVPVIAFVLGAIALALGVWRWRRASGSDEPGAPVVDGPSAADNERLDADLGRYDL
ncbi:MAG TPA: cytochrome c-type biogenesis protein CcmH [Solirubrobacterales bacterium]|nr:cytochrome c-type biogenesis protein CcmH [Solirubrobacterales bacterium]